mgnify:FL=1
MMDIQILCVGKIKEEYFDRAIAEYLRRLHRYANMKITEVADERAPETLSPAERAAVKKKEGARLHKFLRKDAVTIVLAVEGKSMTSEQFAETIRQYGLVGRSRLDFVIGGSLGLDPSILRQADLLLSFSRFTFPHQLMRLIALEQIYRAFRIINGEPYHK